MKCLKKFVALGLCLSMVPCYSTDAVRSGRLGIKGKKEDAIKFYISLQLHEMVLSSSEGLSLICCLLDGESLVVNPNLNVESMSAHLVEVYDQYVRDNKLEDLRKLILDNKKKLYDLTVDSFGEALSRDRVKEGRLLDIKRGRDIAVYIAERVVSDILLWECEHSEDTLCVHSTEMTGDLLYQNMTYILGKCSQTLRLKAEDHKCLNHYLCSNDYDASNPPRLLASGLVSCFSGKIQNFDSLYKKVQDDVWCALGCFRIPPRSDEILFKYRNR